MDQVRVPQVQVDGLLACYRILDFDVLDPETVVATYHVEPDLTVDVFDTAEAEGLIEHVKGSMYRLTEKGEARLDDVGVRSSSYPVVSTT